MSEVRFEVAGEDATNVCDLAVAIHYDITTDDVVEDLDAFGGDVMSRDELVILIFRQPLRGNDGEETRTMVSASVPL